MSTTVTGAKDAIYNTAQNAVTGMVDMVKETVQGSVAATKSLMTSSMSTVMESTLVQGVAHRIHQLLFKIETCQDNVLPITEKELGDYIVKFCFVWFPS